MKLPDFAQFDFTGGIRRDKSDYQLQNNEVPLAVNFEFREKGRVKRRRGFQQWGTTFSGIDRLDNVSTFLRDNAGSFLTRTFAFNRQDTSAAATHYILRTTRLTTALATSDTSMIVASTSGFAASGTLEVEGDIITYTAVPDGTTFTITAASILKAHSAGASVNQWRSSASTLPASHQGIYTATSSAGTGSGAIGNVFIIGGASGDWGQINNNDAETVSAITGEPSAAGIINYRLRLYAIGSGGVSNPSRRVFFSGIGDATSWSTSTDYFDVVDDRGQPITGWHVLNDVLWLFKMNSIFGYDEIELKQRQAYVGAYNSRVVQEVDGAMYTFCPTGIYATNGFTVKNIGEPVKHYWQRFIPTYEGTGDRRVVVNTFAARYDHKYLLWIGNITYPVTLTGAVLAYDTITQTWEVYDNFDSFTFLKTIDLAQIGDSSTAREIVVGGDATKIYRFFENRYIDSTPTLRGTDITEDNISNSIGEPIAASFETKLFHLNSPHLIKSFKRVRILAENPGFNVAWRVEGESGISQYETVGMTSSTNHLFTLPSSARGYRIGFRISIAEPYTIPVFNGLIIEDAESTRGTTA